MGAALRTGRRLGARMAAGRITRQLRDEHDAAIDNVCGLSPLNRRAFWSLVGHPGQRLDVGGIGLQAVTVDMRTRLYEPAEEGPRAIIFPARDLPNCFGAQLVDLVAWLPGTNGIFRRFGVADLLGEWWTAPPVWEEVTVFATPAEWARSNAAGVVLLDWSRAWSSLGHLNHIITRNIPFGRQLEAALKPPAPPPRPRILVQQIETVAAA